MITNKSMGRRRRAILGQREPWSHEQLVEELRQVVGIALASCVATRLLERQGAYRLRVVWINITEELIEQCIPDVLAYPVSQGIDLASASKEAIRSVIEDQAIIIERGREIARGTITGPFRSLFSLGDIEGFWRRVRSAARIATESEHPEGPLRDAPRRIG